MNINKKDILMQYENNEQFHNHAKYLFMLFQSIITDYNEKSKYISLLQSMLDDDEKELKKISSNFINQQNNNVNSFFKKRNDFFKEYKCMPQNILNLNYKDNKLIVFKDEKNFCNVINTIKHNELLEYLEENSLCLLPIEYVNNNIFVNNENENKIKSLFKIQEPNSNNSEYIVTTINNLDISKLLKIDFNSDKCFFPQKFQLIIDSFEFNLPLMKELYNKIIKLENRQSEFEKEYKGIITSINNMQSKLNKIFEKQIDFNKMVTSSLNRLVSTHNDIEREKYLDDYKKTIEYYSHDFYDHYTQVVTRTKDDYISLDPDLYSVYENYSDSDFFENTGYSKHTYQIKSYKISEEKKNEMRQQSLDIAKYSYDNKLIKEVSFEQINFKFEPEFIQSYLSNIIDNNGEINKKTILDINNSSYISLIKNDNNEYRIVTIYDAKYNLDIINDSFQQYISENKNTNNNKIKRGNKS